MVTRSGEGLTFATPQYGYEVHASDLALKKMIPLVMTVRARQLEEFETFSNHQGEEYIYVIEGAVEMHSDIYAPLRLEAGESVYFDSSTPHAFISVGEGDARMLSLCIGSAQAFDALRRASAPEDAKA